MNHVLRSEEAILLLLLQFRNTPQSDASVEEMDISDLSQAIAPHSVRYSTVLYEMCSTRDFMDIHRRWIFLPVSQFSSSRPAAPQ